MLVFLFGKDTFRSRAKLNELVSRYEELPAAERNLRVFDCAEAREDVSEALKASSLFGEKKLIVFKNALQHKEVADALLKEKATLLKSPDTLVFFEQGEAGSHPLSLFLQEHAKKQEFKPLTRAGTAEFAHKKFGAHGKSIAKDALALLLDQTGNDLWRLSQEILKLVAFTGSGQVVERKDAEALLHLSLSADIFATLDALFSQQKQKALQLLSARLAQGDEPLYLLSMLAMQLRRILEAQDLAQRGMPLRALGLHPFAAQKALHASLAFKREKLLSFFEKVCEADLTIKTGRREPKTGLSFLALEI